MNDLIIDPVLKSLIPPLSDEEFKQLEENIKAEGCRDALVIWRGTIVDGHNRLKPRKRNLSTEMRLLNGLSGISLDGGT